MAKMQLIIHRISSIIDRLSAFSDTMQNLLWIVLVAIVIFGVAISLFSINRKANKYTKVVINRLISEGKYIPGLFVELNNTKEILRYYIYSQKWKKRLIKGYNFIYDNSYGNILKKAYKNTNLQFHLKRRASQREILDAIQNAYDLHKDFEKSSVKSDDDYKESMVLFEVISYPYTEALENLLQYSKASDTKYFVLTGSAGNGKTNLLCSISELLINLKEAVVFLNSRDIHGDIWEFICYQLKLPLKHVRKEQYFYLVNFVLLIRKKYLYIIIDAVNENDNDSFDQQIAEFVNEITKYSRIKIIVSCRNEYYKEHFHEYLINKVNTPSVEFDLREQQYTEAAVDKMIRAYCKYFNYRGNISLGVKRILSEQLLLLRIFFEVNKNSCADADSIRKHEIYAQYIEIAKKNSEVDIEKILDGIADFMLNSETYDEVSLADLEKMGIAQEILEKALDGSVLLSKKLISHEGTIAKNEKEVVYFVFDEMRDYYLARRILLKNISADNVDGDLILKNLQKLNLMKVSCAEGIIHYCYIFFRTDQVVEKSNQKEKMCSAILNLYRIPENRKKKSYWHMRHRKEFQNLGLRIIFTSNVKLMDFEIKYIQDCLRKDPYEDGGIIFDTMLDDTLYGGTYNLDIYLEILFGLKNKEEIFTAFHTICARNAIEDYNIPKDFIKFYLDAETEKQKSQIQKIAELFLICFKVNDETTQRELGKFFNKLPLHAEVQNEMFFRLKMACKLEVDDNE